MRSSSARVAGREAAVDDELEALPDGQHGARGEHQRDGREDDLAAR